MAITEKSSLDKLLEKVQHDDPVQAKLATPENSSSKRKRSSG